MIARSLQVWRVARHVPPRQLGRRLWLKLKRYSLSQRLVAQRLRRRAAPLPLRADLPKRVFEPRHDLVVSTHEGYNLRQLNQVYSLRPPLDWSLAARPDATHLERLAFHYHEFLESLPFETGRDIVLDWIARNPPWQSGYWQDSWNSYGLSIRCVCWLQWLAEYRERLAEHELQRIVGSICEQVRFLSRNLETDICGNHLLKNIVCLLWAGSCFRDGEAARWFSLGHRLLKQQLAGQFLPDGMHFELSPAYHCQAFADVMNCVSILAAPDKGAVLERLGPSAQAVADLTHPDDWISLMNDGGLHMAYAPRECLDVWQRLGGRAVQRRSSFGYSNSGFYGLRTPRSYLLIDCGPICASALPAHGHADILAFEWDVDGKRILVDAGVGEYQAGPRRRWGRSTSAHNTVTVGDRDQCELIGSFRTGRRATGRLYEFEADGNRLFLRGHHDGFSRAGEHIVHERSFHAANEHLEIRDQVSGTSSDEAVARLLLHHSCHIQRPDERASLIDCEGTRIRLESQLPFRERRVQWSPDFGQWCETWQIEIPMGSAPCSNLFRFTVL